MKNSLDFQVFEDNYNESKSQLVWKWIVSDTDTPVSAFLKLGKNEPYSFLLESVEGGAVLGRYTILGFDPDLVWKYEGGVVTANGIAQNIEALKSLRSYLETSRIDVLPKDISLPPMASSGLFGFFGYDMVREIEKIPDKNPDNLHIPDSVFIRPRLLLIFDNIMHRICIVSPVYASSEKASPAAVYQTAITRIENCVKELQKPFVKAVLPSEKISFSSFTSNMKKPSFLQMVERAKEYIKAGDIFQVVLSQRFSADFILHPFEFYRSLRRINPSPFLFYLQFPEFSLVGSSPEVLVRVRNGEVTIRPIAGTAKRGKTTQEDQEAAAALLADPKEYSEHLMLLDLGRNDVGRVSKIGSVSVTEKFTIEHYSHVMHIVSNVQGRLKSGTDSLDALLAGFPAGTVSGAPKIRAMEIIDELEQDKRKFYAGCVGYLSGNGNIDTCIALRTALIKDNKIHIQAGAGITASSEAEYEFNETLNKAQALLKAAEDAVEQIYQLQP